MSVINQMLKDLDERSPNSSNNNHQAVAVAQKTSSVKVVSITLVVLLVLNGIGLYIWSLIHENKQLKAQTVILETVKSVAPSVAQLKALQSKPRAKMPDVVESKQQVTRPESELESDIIESTTVQVGIQKEKVIDASVPASNTIPSNSQSSNNIASMPVVASISVFNPSELKPKASMSVSRRQLSAEELVEQKLAQAEKAINTNNLNKAEQLFEDVLIIDPEQQHARKKLAALWFGRKAFNDAINLLSQGIALAPENSEFRSMQAHVLLQQGKLIQAYNSLRPLDHLPQQAYQLLIANISQQIAKYDAAIKAYKILLELQPLNSRWHLGLAIVYDKNSQFVLAVSEYNLALKQGGLSNDSSNFANQRIHALGVQ